MLYVGYCQKQQLYDWLYQSILSVGRAKESKDNAIIGKEDQSHTSQERGIFGLKCVIVHFPVLRQSYEVALFCLNLLWTQSYHI